MNYRVIKSSSIPELETKINSHLNNGWIPLGGIVCDNSQEPDSYLQTIYLPPKKDPLKERLKREEGTGPFGLW